METLKTTRDSIRCNFFIYYHSHYKNRRGILIAKNKKANFMTNRLKTTLKKLQIFYSVTNRWRKTKQLFVNLLGFQLKLYDFIATSRKANPKQLHIRWSVSSLEKFYIQTLNKPNQIQNMNHLSMVWKRDFPAVS